MNQPSTSRRPKRFAEPEVTSAISVWRSLLAASVNSVEKRRAHRAYDPRLELFGIILLAPAFAALTVVILLVLLAIFVIWLCIVGALFICTVVADQVGRRWRRARSFGTLDQRALGYPGR
jgi:Flp pilus assembly protein TadB